MQHFVRVGGLYENMFKFTHRLSEFTKIPWAIFQYYISWELIKRFVLRVV